MVRPVTVHVANGEHLNCKEKYVDVDMQLQGYGFSTTMYSLPIVGVDVILGLPWLESLGPVLTDYKLTTMIFEKNDKSITLTGTPIRRLS